MKLLIVSTQVYKVPPDSYGGLERVCYDLGEALGKAGHDVFVLAPEGSKGEHFTVCSAGPPGIPEEQAYNVIKPSFKDFDLVHDHSLSGQSLLVTNIGGRWERVSFETLWERLSQLFPRTRVSASEMVYLPSGFMKTHTVDELGGIHLVSVPYIMRHRNHRPMVEVTIQAGYKVKLTEDHLMFQAGQNNLVPLPARESLNRRLVVPAYLPAIQLDMKTVQPLLVDLPDKAFLVDSSVPARLPRGSHVAVLERYPQIKGASASTRVSNWRRKGHIPVWAAKQFGDDWSTALLRGAYGTTIPLDFPLTDSLLMAFGLWLGDGCYDKCGVNWANAHEPDCFQVLDDALRPVGIHLSKGKVRAHGCSIALKYLMQGLGFKGKAYTKTVPEWVFRLSDRQLGLLLRGYFSADAGFRSHTLTLCSASKQMAHQTRDLLIRLGIWCNLRQHKRLWELSVNQSDYQDFAGKVGLIQIAKHNRLQSGRRGAFRLNRRGQCRLQKVTAITRIPNEQWVYDLAVPPWERFVADGVLVHNSWAGYPYAFKREWPKLKLLHTIHSQRPYNTKPVEKPCFVAASQAQADYLKSEVGFDCKVVHHGIDLSFYQFDAQKEDFLLYLNRVMDEKGTLEFVSLCKSVGMKGMVAGEDVTVPDPLGYPRRVMEACEQSGGLVRYLGRIPHEYKLELLQKARCLVSPLKPPYIEIYGLSLVEALACGTPVLVTDQGAPRELVAHGVSGAIARDLTCLEENLKIALNCEPAACRKSAEGFSRETMAAEYLKLYQQILVGGLEW